MHIRPRSCSFFVILIIYCSYICPSLDGTLYEDIYAATHARNRRLVFDQGIGIPFSIHYTLYCPPSLLPPQPRMRWRRKAETYLQIPYPISSRTAPFSLPSSPGKWRRARIKSHRRSKLFPRWGRLSRKDGNTAANSSFCFASSRVRSTHFVAVGPVTRRRGV